MLRKIVLSLVLSSAFLTVFGQVQARKGLLEQMYVDLKEKDSLNLRQALHLASQKGWQLSFRTAAGNTAVLVGVDSFGKPVYYTSESNVVAAATTGANLLWNGGSSGLNLSGSSLAVKGRLGVWDGGRVLGTHTELTGRVTQKDNPSGFSDHATHVTGTLMATGVSANAKGMAYGLQEIAAYDFNSHLSEMSGEASTLLVSNHSYGTLSGWVYNAGLNRWEYYGTVGSNEDQNLGYYNSEAQLFDSIAYNAPYYLIVKSSGNKRNENGPSEGAPYWRYDANGQMVSAGPRPGGMSSNDGYDIIPTYGTAKNILTVGAVNGIAGGYTNVNDVVMSSFSSWGPTDDGRIKPDVVANGVNLFSSIATNSTAYAIYSGTSMATPNAAGSLLLLQEYYNQVNGNFMRAATLKGLAIHSADEAGAAPGPDYKFGWGLLNVGKASNVIKSKNLQTHQIFENMLTNGSTYTLNVVASGPLTATISWTDPKGTVTTTNILNNTTRKLVNDLDIRIIQGSTVYAPWKLDPANPGSAATTGDNDRDNVERININNAVPGLSYTIQITHKGTLDRGQQAYSLILSGINGQVYCTSNPTSTAGARIDSVGFGSIQKLNDGTCTSYTDYTSLSASVEPSQVIPFHVRVNSCDASVADKIVKIFIDFDNNGSFADAGELVATSGVISGNGSFTGNVTIAPHVIVGTGTLMRVIVQETNNPADVSSCGTYARGETQDYKLLFAPPSFDLRVEALVDPLNGACANTGQYVTVRLKNNGTATQANIPLTLDVKNGTTTVMTANGLFAASIAPNETRNYTFQVPFTGVAGTSYSVLAYINTPQDQIRGNDTLKTTISVPAAGPAPSGLARICGPSSILMVDNPGAQTYFWYSNPANPPIGTGTNLFNAPLSTNNTYYLGTGMKNSLGLPAKSAFANGGGYQVGSSRVDLQACKLEYSIVSPK